MENSVDLMTVHILQNQLKEVTEQLRYPNIKIKVFTSGFHLVVKGTLQLPTDNHDGPNDFIVAKAELYLDPYGRTDAKHIEYIKQNLIRDIACKYLERAVAYHERTDIKGGED